MKFYSCGFLGPFALSRGLCFSLLAMLVTGVSALAGVNVWTQHNDNARTGQNTNETILTPANVKSATFGRLFSQPVDGYVYAQPLVIQNVSMGTNGVRNVLIVATEHDSVYAFDADSGSGTNAGPIWRVSFIDPPHNITTVPNADVGSGDIVPEIGITSTPVVDTNTMTLYVEVKTKETSIYRHRLHALDLATGAERSGSPIIIQATVAGNGDGNDGAGHVPFNALRQMNRPGLLLLNGVVYMAYASHGDNGPYHGWVLGYNAQTLQQVGVYNTTHNGGLGGIWQGGTGPAADDQANIYFETGNGTLTTNINNRTTFDLGDSFIKLSSTNSGGNVLAVADFFTPFNQASLNSVDADLGSGGNVVLPDSVGNATHPHLLIGSGKEGRIYLIDRDKMGAYRTDADSQIVQVTAPNTVVGSFGAPAYFNNTIYYLGGYGDHLKAFHIANGALNATPVSQATGGNFGFPGSSPSISANGTANAIVWVLQNDGFANSPAILHAYNATNVAVELYNSSQAGARDRLGNAVKFTVPTIANGKVYVGSQFQVTVLGQAAGWVSAPTISPNGGTFTTSAQVTLSSSTSGASIYYTTDGSTPTITSTLYTGPFTILKSGIVKAFATAAGLVDSSVTAATFLNSSVIGNGTGLLGHYWSNQAKTTNGVPTLTRVDATVNFDWGTGSPAASISADTFTVLWSGQVQPQFDETYTFYTTTDDGVRLWVNNQLIMNQWVDQGPTEASATISLAAGKKYDIRMAYYENGGGAVATLSWSSLSTAKTIIPTNQLYPVENTSPTVSLTSPAAGAGYVANSASVLISANAVDSDGSIAKVDFFSGSTLLASLSNAPYAFTLTKVAPGAYSLTAKATDDSGATTTSSAVSISVNPSPGPVMPYGLTNRLPVAAYLNMPQNPGGAAPTLLSQTGAFMDSATLAIANGLIAYGVNTPLWSDGAVKTRWMSVPNNGAPFTPDEQIMFSATGEWTFPAGTVFVKHFELPVDETDPAVKRRLETRLLVRARDGGVYGVAYKWRADNSDADLLAGSLTEPISIKTSSGTRTQNWYYPSPQDCLVCHTPVAGYVLGVKTRQLNCYFRYPGSGNVDNQIRTLNQLGMLNPAIADETTITNLTKLEAITNTSASSEVRVLLYRRKLRAMPPAWWSGWNFRRAL